jgi:hypothetical protein
MEKELLIQKIRQAYKNYCETEYGDIYDDDEVKEDILGVMYTSVNEEEWETQVSFNLVLETEIIEVYSENEKFVHEEKCSLEDILDMLTNWCFDDFYGRAHESCDEKFNLDLEW